MVYTKQVKERDIMRDFFKYILPCIVIILLIIISFFFFKQVSLKDNNIDKLNRDTRHSPSIGEKGSKNLIIEFMDFKCPYCKKLEQTSFKKLENKKFLKKNNVELRIVNASILGKDSIKAARAGQALNIYYPEKYEDFHKELFKQQPNSERTWINNKVIDETLDSLHIPEKKLKKIKISYKTKNSKSWKATDKDKYLYRKYNIDYVPSVYVNGKFIKDPYKIKNIKEYLQ